MTPWKITIYTLIAAVIIGLGLLIVKTPAQELPEAPLGRHPLIGSEKHWYPYQCCGLSDCAAIDGVRQEGGKYVWRSWRWPDEYTLSIPMNDARVKAAHDGRFHACEAAKTRMNSKGGYEQTGAKVMCFFVPFST